MNKYKSERLMKIIINGKTEELEVGTTIHKILSSNDLKPDSVVVELNETVIETEHYSKTVLKENDRLEVLSFVGGG
ncbi:sulfur carrier protein ThiS [Desulforegula conservatrix]|uniref:sulfur carrier protein ThiS n=1 Tax=Desulforegula conservatrix TaxID=153026 RepID=UPI0018DCA7F1|nr:sulfur carrier protein ThiS [Desulforegula conservatrix]